MRERAPDPRAPFGAVLLFCAACPPPTTSPPSPVGSTAPVVSSAADAGSAAPGSPTRPLRARTFLDAVTADAVSLQPLRGSDTTSGAFRSKLWARLARVDPATLEMVGVLYEDRPVLSPDGKTLTWRLRDGIEWSDGVPITAADVAFTWDKMMDPRVPFAYRTNFRDAFEAVRALDDRAVEYTLAQPNFCPALLNSPLITPLPRHAFEDFDFSQTTDDFRPTVTSGPFRLIEWQRGKEAVFGDAFAGYVAGRPLLDAYVFRVVEDNATRTQLFRDQEIDVAYPDPAEWDEVSRLPFAQPFAYYSAASPLWTYVAFNLRHPLLSNRALRQALSTALDKSSLLAKVRRGHAQRQYSTVPVSSWAAAASDQLPRFDYDPEQANAGLDRAGYPRGADGVRVARDGTRLHFRLEYAADNQQRQQIAALVRDDLAAVGVSVEVAGVDAPTLRAKTGESHDFDLVIGGWLEGIDPSNMKALWTAGSPLNMTGYSNPKVEALYLQAATVPGCGRAARKALYVEIQKILAEDQPYVFLWTDETLEVYHRRVVLNPPTALGVMYDIEKVRIDPGAQ